MEEDSDDALYHGVIPNLDDFRETSCSYCKEKEQNWGDIRYAPLHTPLQFQKLKDYHYNNMVNTGFLKTMVDIYLSEYPNGIDNYKILKYALKKSENREGKPVLEKIKELERLDYEIKCSEEFIESYEKRKKFIEGLISEMISKRKKVPKEPSPVIELPETLDHVCNPNCRWCRLHCHSAEKIKNFKEKLCDCKCVMLG